MMTDVDNRKWLAGSEREIRSWVQSWELAAIFRLIRGIIEDKPAFAPYVEGIMAALGAALVEQRDQLIPQWTAETVRREADSARAAMEAIVSEIELLSAREVLPLIESSATNAADAMSKLAQRGNVVRLNLRGQTLYPAFQFEHGLAAFRKISKINRMLDAGKHPWEAASWWLTANGRIQAATGKWSRPVDLITQPGGLGLLETAVGAEAGIPSRSAGCDA